MRRTTWAMAMEQLKVSTKSNPNSVAGAMAGVLRQHGAVEVQVVGAGALNQAIKAVAIARGYVASGGLDLVCIPSFADIEIEGERRTAIRLIIEDRLRRRLDDEVIVIPDESFGEIAIYEDADVSAPGTAHRLN